MLRLIKMSASWCGPCQVLAPTVEALREEFPEIEFQFLDVDQNMDLARKYGIGSVPTLILEKDGRVVWRKSGLISKEDLRKKLSSF